MNDIKVKIANNEDFESIQILFRKMFDIYSENQEVEYPFSENGINYLVNRIENGFAFIARGNDKTMGFLTGCINDSIEFKAYKKYGFVENMFVEEEYRKNGIGKLLITAFLKKCESLDIKYIQTESDANQELINFYTGLGFKISGINYFMKI